MSYVQTKDVLSTLTRAEAGGISDTRSNEVWSVDYDGKIPSLNSNLAAEIAQSSSDSAPRSTIGERLNKNAYKVSNRTRTKRFGNFRLIYERVQPGFQTLTGYTTPDRNRWNINWNRRFGRAWSMTTDFEQWHDGLEGSREHNVTDWRFGTSYDPTMTGYWRYSSRASLQNRQDDGRAAANDPNETDELLLTLITQQKLGENTIDAEFVHEDQQSDSETRDRFELGFTIPFIFTGRNWQYETNGYYEKEQNDLGPTAETDRRFRFSNTVIIGHNELETLELSQSYSEEDAANSQEIIRETLRISYHYTINPSYGDKFSFSYYLNDNDNMGDPTQDYQEETLEMTLNVSF
jgi:hypothetical protein